MYDDQSKEFANQFVLQETINIDLYETYIGKEALTQIKKLAEPLKGKSWTNVNSTCVGGGVAEMLHSVIPFARGLGIACNWYVIEGLNDFFTVTKKFHNLLQGQDIDISMKEIFEAYLETVNSNMKDKKIVGDLVVVHDPQPAAAIMSGSILGNTLWRCHIDTSEANKYIWKFMLPYINQFDGAIFTDTSFVKEGLKTPLYKIAPAIDPLKEKNKQLSEEEARETLQPLASKHGLDLDRPVILAVSRYDIHKNQETIIKAFQKAKNSPALKDLNPLMIVVGNSASDDPEGQEMYEKTQKIAGNDKDIHLLLNIKNNDKNIGALMKLAKCFVHVSTKEGFGLVVTEAMWQGTPVIGSRVGGITQQVIDQENGFLVEPMDIEKIAEHMKTLVTNQDLRNNLAKAAVEHIRNNFLLPHLVKKYILLMRYFLEIDNNPPDFRFNGISYNEIRKYLYGRKKSYLSDEELYNELKMRSKI